MKKCFNAETVQEIREKYSQGISTRTLSDEYYADFTTIWHYCKNITPINQGGGALKISPQRIKQIQQCYRLGEFCTHIARRLGISKWTVYKYIKLSA